MILEKYINNNGLYIIEYILPQFINNFLNFSAFRQEFVDNIIYKK